MKNFFYLLAVLSFAACELPVCGDGKIDEDFEECDDGNALGGDGCSFVCKNEVCGNGIPDTAAGEECDDADISNNNGCLNDCSDPECGDGFVFLAVEECDDGNDQDGDGCDRFCEVE